MTSQAAALMFYKPHVQYNLIITDVYVFKVCGPQNRSQSQNTKFLLELPVVGEFYSMAFFLRG
jgi:hypothetical protein